MFRKTIVALAGAATACVGFMGSAEAMPLTKSINLAGSGPDVSSLFFDLNDGLKLTVTAGIHSGGASANAPLNIIGSADITQTGGDEPGIGVRSGRFDSSQLDSAGPNEFLRFTFNQEVTLLSTIFESASNAGPGADEFDAGVDGVDLQITDTFGTDTLRNFPGARFPGRTDRLVDFRGGVDFAGDGTNALFPATGSIFDFYTDDNNDSFRIRKLKVEFDSTPVPTPAAVLPGLIGMGFSAIRKRKQEVEIEA